MEAKDKYNKDHLNDPKNRKPLPYYKRYYLDVIYRKICYRNQYGQWMYPRMDVTKPGHVLIYSARQLVAVNERAIAHTLLGPYIPDNKMAGANKIITSVMQEAKTPVTKKATPSINSKAVDMSDAKPLAKKTLEPKKMGRPKKEEKQFTILSNARRMQDMFGDD